MSEEYKQKLKCLFAQADKSGDGYLSIQEVTKILRCAGNQQTDAEIARDFVQDDTDEDSKLSFDEFWAAVKRRDPKTVTKDELRCVFKDLDADGSGALTVSDLKRALQNKYSDAQMEAMIRNADCDKDGKVNYEEFLRSWNP